MKDNKKFHLYGPMKNARGFTLVEMSIVLVVVALLVGAIVGGRSLVSNAHLRSITTDVSDYIGAAKSFQDKYNYLPGDIPNATTYWSGTGDGNGNSQVATGETLRFWQHLSLSGFASGNFSGVAGGGGATHHVIGTNAPISKMAGGGFSFYYLGTTSGHADFYDGNFGHIFQFGAGTATTYTQGPLLTADDAHAIDIKIDDGLPSYGSVQAFKSTSTVTPLCTTTAASTTAAYVTGATTQLCNLVFMSGL